LRNIAYHVAANTDIRVKLHDELKKVFLSPEDEPSLQELERLPYLTAVIQEGLRVSNPVVHRLPRCFPEKALKYGEYVIPPGVPVESTPYLVHHDEKIFPDPYEFRPDRWLGSKGQGLQRYFVAFMRGTRACLGQNLAWAELYLILAHVFARFDFDVSAVDKKRDIDLVRDVILAAPAKGSEGILVKVRSADVKDA
jgi:cytochrome P450